MKKKIVPLIMKITAVNGVADFPEQVYQILSIKTKESNLYLIHSKLNEQPEYESVLRSLYYRVVGNKIYFTRHYSKYKFIAMFQRWKENIFPKNIDYIIEYYDHVQYLNLHK